jgi:hypothetical protein
MYASRFRSARRNKVFWRNGIRLWPIRLRTVSTGRLLPVIATLTLSLCVASPTRATVLTFDLGGVGTPAIDQNYGDRVNAATVGAFSYGTAGGFTPNVLVGYLPNDGLVIRWETGYGDLVNVIEYENVREGPLQVVFTADPGFQVTLTSFDPGGSPNTDYILPSFQILGDNTLLFAQSDVLVRGATGTPRHTSIDLSALGLTASTLTLRINQHPLGINSDNIGVDNIQFSQQAVAAAAPEPGSLALLALAGLPALGAVVRRNRVSTRRRS